MTWSFSCTGNSSFVWASSFVHCLAALDLRAGFEQPFNCLIIQNRHAVQSVGRSMDWTLEDNMVDGLFFCATLTGRKEAIPHLYKQERKRLTSVRRRLNRTQALLGRVIPGGWVFRCRGWKCGVLWRCPPTPHSIDDPPTAPHLCCCCQMNRWDIVWRVQMGVSIWGAMHLHSMDGWALSGGDVQAPWHGVLESVAPLRRGSAGWMLARIGRLSAGSGRRHPVTIRKASLMAESIRRVWALRRQTGSQYSAVQYTRARVAVSRVVAPALQPEPASCLRSATRDVSFLRNDSRWRRKVSDLSNVTPRFLGSEQKGRVSLLMLTFGSRLASTVTVNNCTPHLHWWFSSLNHTENVFFKNEHKHAN